jgi:class 3 adenylate cyclase
MISVDDEEMAKMMSKILLTSSASHSTIGSSLANRAALITAITKLAKNVPACVLRKISKDSQSITDSCQKETLPSLSEGGQSDDIITSNDSDAPYSETYRGALLFVDMSGFTKLAQVLDVESLSKVRERIELQLPFQSNSFSSNNLYYQAINCYFQAIVDEVTTHGGDILKFAGDAIFAEWRVEENDEVEIPHSPTVTTESKTCNLTDLPLGLMNTTSQRSKSSGRRTSSTSTLSLPRSSTRSPTIERETNVEEGTGSGLTGQPSKREILSPKTKKSFVQSSRMSIHNKSESSTFKNAISARELTATDKVKTSPLANQEPREKRPIPERHLNKSRERRNSATNIESNPSSLKGTAFSHGRTKSMPGASSIGDKSTLSKPRSNISKIRQRHSSSSEFPTHKLNLEDCVHAAAVCGSMIVNKCADYPIFANSVSGGKGPLVATLNVHCGLGVGAMAGIHVGNDSSRREYLIVGDPIDQVAEACDSAGLGEIKASGEALEYLNRGQTLKHQLRLDKNTKSKTIASRKKIYFSKRRKATWSLDGKIRKPVKPRHKSFEIPFDDMNMANLKAFHRTLSFYVHPVVICDESSEVAVPSTRNGNQAQDRFRAEAELRSVFTIFITPKITAKLTNNDEQNARTFKQLDDIMNVVTSVLESYKGHLRQYIVDDKGK